MTAYDINKYRLTNMEEPSDEMLEIIMREAAEDAKEKHLNAKKLYSEQLQQLIIENISKWQNRINKLVAHD